MNIVDSEGNKLSKEQMEYFKNSKIIDDSGNLLVVYHGTNTDFDIFDKNVIGGISGKSHLMFGSGFYFTVDLFSASGYGNVKAYYINIVKPYTIDIDNNKFMYSDDIIHKFKQKMIQEFNLLEYVNNEDGLVGDEITKILKNNGYDGVYCGYNYIIAFEPNQIKAITNKKPTNHDNINEAVTEAYIKLYEDFNLEYGDYERPPYNDGDLQRAIDNNTPKEDYYGSVNLDAFFKGYPAGGCVWEDVENSYDYDNGESLYVWRSIKQFKEIFPDKSKQVRIYRTVPNTVNDTEIHNGDWVTLSKRYAKEHGDLRYTNNYHILTALTTTDKLWWYGDHICEFGLDDTPIRWK